jgi:hypothetical protein
VRVCCVLLPSNELTPLPASLPASLAVPACLCIRCGVWTLVTATAACLRTRTPSPPSSLCETHTTRSGARMLVALSLALKVHTRRNTQHPLLTLFAVTLTRVN